MVWATINEVKVSMIVPLMMMCLLLALVSDIGTGGI